MALTLTTPPTAEVISLEEAKLQARVTLDDEDALIEALRIAAREWIEALTGRALIDQVWTLTLDRMPADGEIVLPRPPLRSVTSVQYVDAAGAPQTWAFGTGYQVQIPGGPYAERGRIAPVYGTSAPSARAGTLDAVTVVFRAGYGTAPKDVPRPLRLAVALVVQHIYDGGGLEVAPAAVQALIAPYINRATC